MNWIDRIFSVSDDRFEELAMEIFQYQLKNNTLYAEFCEQFRISQPKDVSEIPFLPISFFKNHSVIIQGKEPMITFKSSGTGGDRSKHLVADVALYEHSFTTNFVQTFGDLSDLTILALLPNYLEQGESSLVYMVDVLIQGSNNPFSGFVLGDREALMERIHSSRTLGKKIILFGVSYALLDLAAHNPDLSDVIIIETGGMKGRRREMTKDELHFTLKNAFGLKQIHSEYGMTELLSQAYSSANGIFVTPKWMKILIRDTNDPLELIENGRSGGINVIDLANVYSCPFIATQDLGRSHDAGFEILGRFDLADIRGCNLLIQ